MRQRKKAGVSVWKRLSQPANDIIGNPRMMIKANNAILISDFSCDLASIFSMVNAPAMNRIALTMINPMYSMGKRVR